MFTCFFAHESEIKMKNMHRKKVKIQSLKSQKRARLVLLLFLGSIIGVYAQENVGIGTAEPNEAAILEMKSTNRGVLIPRVNLNENTVLKGGENPTGVLVFNNGLGNLNKRGFYFWNGNQWELLALNTEVVKEIARVDQRIDQIRVPQVVIGEVEVPTNEVINGKVVYVGQYNVEVASPANTSLPYNTTIKDRLSIANLSKVIEAKIYDASGELVLQNITAISTTAEGVSFCFGMKHMYTALPTGRYQVILKYISTIAAN